MLKITVLVSGGGTNLQAIMDRIGDGTITNAEIVSVISNNKNAFALERAAAAGIPASCVSPKDYPGREAFNEALLRAVDATGALELTFFNQSYVADSLLYGQEYYFYGAVRGDYTGYGMQNPVFEPLERAGTATRRIVPVYPLTAGISNALLVKAFLPEAMP